MDTPDKNAETTVISGGDRKRWLQRLHRLASIVQWVVNAGVLAAVLLVFTPLGDRLGQALLSVDPLEKADYIIVLGGDHERGAEAAYLYREGWAPKVIVSSRGQGADDLAAMVQAYGVPNDAILIDRDATRTADHPHTVAKLAGVDMETHRFIVVTSPFHTSRSRACFIHAGFRHIRARGLGWRTGGRFGPEREDWTGRARDLSTKLYEFFAWCVYRLRGWV